MIGVLRVREFTSSFYDLLVGVVCLKFIRKADSSNGS